MAELTRDALRNMGRYIAGADVLLCGASYRQDVGDTRYSGSEMVVRKLTELGADMRVHDPYVDHWYELEKQDIYPAPGHSWSRFFRNQDDLVEHSRAEGSCKAALAGAEAVILAVPHEAYVDLDPQQVVEWSGSPLAVVDCFGILTDEQIRDLFRTGLRGQSPGPRTYSADQRTSPNREVAGRSVVSGTLVVEANQLDPFSRIVTEQQRFSTSEFAHDVVV